MVVRYNVKLYNVTLPFLYEGQDTPFLLWYLILLWYCQVMHSIVYELIYLSMLYVFDSKTVDHLSRNCRLDAQHRACVVKVEGMVTMVTSRLSGQY